MDLKIVDRLANTYQAWFSDVTRKPIERPPIPVGQIQLGAGRVRVALKALDRPADRVCNLKSLWLERVN